ncbi:FimA protein [Propionibacterium freudenreichii]|nr:FimA protein [Propionibacterium freudenreichii]CEI22160.1 FimA protein [Propionibacterium freudenreichii]
MVMASLAMFGASRASAADVGNPATIDPGATGTLNVNKRVNPTGTPTPGNGLEQANVTGDPLGGIEFVVKQIPGIDLTIQAGWDALAAMTVDQARTATQNVAGSSQTTNAAGLASFTGLPLGGYLVQEKLTPRAAGERPHPLTRLRGDPAAHPSHGPQCVAVHGARLPEERQVVDHQDRRRRRGQGAR